MRSVAVVHVATAVAVLASVGSVGAFAPSSRMMGRHSGVFGTDVPKLSYVVTDEVVTALNNRIGGCRLFSQPTNDEENNSAASTLTLVKGEEEEQKKSSQSPIANPKVQALRAQAKQARLEAERLDLQLTIEKLERLETELKKVKATGKSAEELDMQIAILQRKLRGEPPVLMSVPATSSNKTSSNNTLATATEKKDGTEGNTDSSVPLGRGIDLSIKPFDQDLYNNVTEAIAGLQADSRLLELRILAMQVGITDEKINTTEVAIRTEMASRGDFSFFTDVPTDVTFDEEEMEAAKSTLAILENGFIKMFTDDIFEADTGYMDDEMKAKIAIAEEFYLDYLNVELDEESLNEELPQMVVRRNYELQFPNCIDKEGETPTEDEANTVLDLLPAAGFMPSSKPFKVMGGYIIPGERTKADRNQIVDALDTEVARNSKLRGKVNLCLVEDLSEEELTDIEALELEEAEELPPTTEAIYVLGPDIGREPQTLLKTSSTILGVAGAWLMSLYPTQVSLQGFNEQTQSSIASVDLSILAGTDMSRPIFAVFMACLLAHELAHGTVSGIYKLETSVPTFVPSPTTGITSTITSFKAPPKNREQLFDFAFAGPIAGMMASFAALVVGCQLTVDGPTAAANSFPELSLDILRQSTMGGAVIEWFLGSGTLTIPAGAEEQMVGVGLGLHPVAIAGFTGLFVNALALLPIGTTDGGRIAETMFGRDLKGLIGTLTLLWLMGSGVFGGNQLLGFYALFCIACQLGNELPLRNDLDDISFPRVLAAITGFLTAILVLFPMQ